MLQVFSQLKDPKSLSSRSYKTYKNTDLRNVPLRSNQPSIPSNKMSHWGTSPILIEIIWPSGILWNQPLEIGCFFHNFRHMTHGLLPERLFPWVNFHFYPFFIHSSKISQRLINPRFPIHSSIHSSKISRSQDSGFTMPSVSKCGKHAKRSAMPSAGMPHFCITSCAASSCTSSRPAATKTWRPTGDPIGKLL